MKSSSLGTAIVVILALGARSLPAFAGEGCRDSRLSKAIQKLKDREETAAKQRSMRAGMLKDVARNHKTIQWLSWVAETAGATDLALLGNAGFGAFFGAVVTGSTEGALGGARIATTLISQPAIGGAVGAAIITGEAASHFDKGTAAGAIEEAGQKAAAESARTAERSVEPESVDTWLAHLTGAHHDFTVIAESEKDKVESTHFWKTLPGAIERDLSYAMVAELTYDLLVYDAETAAETAAASKLEQQCAEAARLSETGRSLAVTAQTQSKKPASEIAASEAAAGAASHEAK